jgi:hypothetical protein
MPAAHCLIFRKVSLSRTRAVLDYVKCRRQCFVCNKNYATDERVNIPDIEREILCILIYTLRVIKSVTIRQGTCRVQRSKKCLQNFLIVNSHWQNPFLDYMFTYKWYVGCEIENRTAEARKWFFDILYEACYEPRDSIIAWNILPCWIVVICLERFSVRMSCFDFSFY